MSVLEKLTEGIVDRNLSRDGAALMDKWEQTGLLEGIADDNKRQGMARLLENQAKQLLKEASTLGAGDVQGFASVAFPIVRRVFGGLIANDLVSVQPMSLPSGLIFFLDFKYDNTVAGAGATAGESVYGGGVLGSGLTGGVDLTGANAEKSFYALNNGYTSPRITNGNADGVAANGDLVCDVTGGAASVVRAHTMTSGDGTVVLLTGSLTLSQLTGSNAFARKAILHDPDFPETSRPVVLSVPRSMITGSNAEALNEDNLISIALEAASTGTDIQAADELLGTPGTVRQLRRLTHEDPDNAGNILLVFERTAAPTGTVTDSEFKVSFQQDDQFDVIAGVPGGVVGDIFALEAAQGSEDNGSPTGGDIGGENISDGTEGMKELNIDVSSIAVTTQTKKLKAKWTPELGQDLNAYHNLDAEVELTQLLSEHIALEIDREILQDLVKGAKADTYHWSRRPGKFLNRDTGAQVGGDVANESLMGADFTGTVSEWYETLIETINDVSAQIHRKTLRGGANFLVCSPEVANILEFTSGFRANITHDENKGDVGAVKAGSLSRKFDVYVDPYFPRNIILVGRRGNSFLESGYVYAPYVPLQVTPTIFGTEDFVPRKGVMTRYAKKMVRPDMYGLVICHDLLG